MSASNDRRLAEVDSLLERVFPLLNMLSSSAWFIHEGKLHYSKHREVQDELVSWIQRNRGVLPDDVVNAVSRLNFRISEWVSSSGRSSGMNNFANDEESSFREVNVVLAAYKSKLLSEMDSKEEDLQIRIARDMRNPWTSGSFYLAAAVVLAGLMAVIANTIPLWTFPIVVIASVTLLSVVGAFQLRQDERLSERSFLELMTMSFTNLPALLRKSQPPAK